MYDERGNPKYKQGDTETMLAKLTFVDKWSFMVGAILFLLTTGFIINMISNLNRKQNKRKAYMDGENFRFRILIFLCFSVFRK